jgi:hypothetical protein
MYLYWAGVKSWITTRFWDLSKQTIQVNILSLSRCFSTLRAFEGVLLAEFTILSIFKLKKLLCLKISPAS